MREFRDRRPGRFFAPTPALGRTKPLPQLPNGQIAAGARSSRSASRTTASRPRTRSYACTGPGLQGTLVVAIPMRDVDDTLAPSAADRGARRRRRACSRSRVSPGGSFGSGCGRSSGWARPRARSRPAICLAGSSPPTRRPRSGGSASRSTRCSRQIEDRVRGTHRVGERLRRFVADASHELRTPAHVDPRVRGAVPARRQHPARRPREDDAPDRGSSRRAWACSSTTSSCSRGSTRAGRSNTARSTSTRLVARRGRRPARHVTRSPGHLRGERRDRRERRRVPAAPGAREPARERAHAHAAGDSGRGAGHADGRATRSSRCATTARA